MRIAYEEALLPITLVDEDEIGGSLALLAKSMGELPLAAAAQRFHEAAHRFELPEAQLRKVLVESSLEWTTDEARSAAWLHRCHDRFSTMGFDLSRRALADWGDADPRTLGLVAQTLQSMGETVKWEVAVTPNARHDYTKPHRLIGGAIASRTHRAPVTARFDGRDWPASLEALYLRLLLLARFAGGNLGIKRMEILDAWLWMWMPVLSAVGTPPAGAALRVDLDSCDGLRLGPRPVPGPSLYIPQGPIERAHREVLVQLHAGKIVPSRGTASRMRIEEHVAVMQILRRGIRQSLREPAQRAPREACSRKVELLVGLAEISARRGTPPPSPVLASVDGMRCAPERDRSGLPLQAVYDLDPRMVELTDVSASGYGVDAPESRCGSVVPGDLVAIVDRGVTEIAKVVRRVPAKTAGRIVLGLVRLVSGVRMLPVLREETGRRAEDTLMPFVSGPDLAGRDDAFLLSEQTYQRPAKLTAIVGRVSYTLRLNRIRQHGRGWVLAGFEVTGSRAA